MSLWGGRFETPMDPAAWRLNTSLPFDQRLALQDVRGSMAWANALAQAGVLTAEEQGQIVAGLRIIEGEFREGKFVFSETDEDIHSAVERRLTELIGPLGGKLHSGRSRNDQVATDLRLWLLDNLPHLREALRAFQQTLVERAEQDLEVLLPGYTHWQRAQVITLGHWWLAHFWPLQRDRQRLAQLAERVAVLPLGSGALAGTPFAIDRHALAAELGFRLPAPNSLDAVADRDFVAEFLFCAALIGVHLSRLAEGVTLFTSAEFGFFELDDAFATGSSLMPQKKNPDLFELARGKSGALIGYLSGLLTTLKGLASAYDKDLQEDKPPLFAAFDALMSLLPPLREALRTLRLHPERMREALEDALMATDLADYFVERGIPFRQAHTLVGKAMRLALERAQRLSQLSLDDYRSLLDTSPRLSLDESLYAVFDPRRSVARRNAWGGTSPQAVRAQLEQARQALNSL